MSLGTERDCLQDRPLCEEALASCCFTNLSVPQQRARVAAANLAGGAPEKGEAPERGTKEERGVGMSVQRSHDKA